MLHDLDYATDGSGRGTPRFFPAHVRRRHPTSAARPKHDGGCVMLLQRLSEYATQQMGLPPTLYTWFLSPGS